MSADVGYGSFSRVLRLRRSPAARRGSALVLALIVVMIVASLGAAYLQVATSITSRQSNEVENVKAFYLAEAGLAESFQAVRMGRTGQVGSQFTPATHGEGLLWVDALAMGEEQVRLESTALVGAGRATLALVVEPIEIPLGFFSEEDLLVDSVLLVDGFDSQEGTYEEALPGSVVTIDPATPFTHVDSGNNLLFYGGSFYRFHGVDGNTYYYDYSVSVEALAAMERYATEFDIQWDDFVDGEFEDDEDQPPPGSTHPDFSDIEYQGVLTFFSELPGYAPPTPDAGLVASAPTTGSGGLLGSNGDITFVTADGEPATIYGDVIPGPAGTVTSTDTTITGSTDTRSTEVELPEVEVPPVTLQEPVRHADALPMLISPGTSGYERIEVAPDAELILRGPATIVIGTLVLEPGALLTLDTRDGDVELYITGEGMDLQEGSVVTTSGDMPEETSIQVGPIASGADGAPVKLEATSQFHGTIYAPETEVYVGSDFEVYGGIVARKLEIGPGARLHFDNAGFEGSAIPRILSWRIVEIPIEARSREGDVFEVLGVDPSMSIELSQAHDLGAVELNVDYKDHGGVERSYSGAEDLFDWEQVAEVVQVERDPHREGEEEDGGADDAPPPVDNPDYGPPPVGVRASVWDVLNDTTASEFEVGFRLYFRVPFSPEEWAAIYDRSPPLSTQTLDGLRNADEYRGGSGG